MIEVKHLSKAYKDGKETFKALKDVSLKIVGGEFVAILGPSGSGKSTLLHLIGGLDKPTEGEIVINDQDISSFSEKKLARFRNKEIGFVFQFFNLITKLSVYDNVNLPLVYSSDFIDNPKEKIKQVLASVGLERKIKNRVLDLSGGEQQRVAISRALVNDPKIILADEPTGNLDSHNGQEVFKILLGLKGKGKTVVLVTHDENLAKMTDRIISIKDGMIE